MRKKDDWLDKFIIGWVIGYFLFAGAWVGFLVWVVIMVMKHFGVI